MSESGDYQPSTQWRGHDFGAARAAFDTNAGRSYAQAQAKGLTASKLLPLSIETKSTHPVIIDTDFTGSMDGWDATIFSKFPYLDHELRTEYLDESFEASFGAICDTGDAYPLQIRNFAKGADMKKTITELVHAGGGSGPGNICEAHGLAMLYRLRNTHMPKAIIKPTYIIITDEMPYGRIAVEEAETFAKVKIEKAMNIKDIVRELREIYSVYVVLKPYGTERLSGDQLSGSTRDVYDCWKELVGADHIALLPDPDRVVDVIFGILAKESDRIGYFRTELEARQLPDKNGQKKVDTVYKSLKTIHSSTTDSKAKSSVGHSKTKGLGGGKATKSLLP
jgi:hypothetical protein